MIVYFFDIFRCILEEDNNTIESIISEESPHSKYLRKRTGIRTISYDNFEDILNDPDLNEFIKFKNNYILKKDKSTKSNRSDVDRYKNSYLISKDKNSLKRFREKSSNTSDDSHSSPLDRSPIKLHKKENDSRKETKKGNEYKKDVTSDHFKTIKERLEDLKINCGLKGELVCSKINTENKTRPHRNYSKMLSPLENSRSSFHETECISREIYPESTYSSSFYSQNDTLSSISLENEIFLDCSSTLNDSPGHKQSVEGLVQKKDIILNDVPRNRIVSKDPSLDFSNGRQTEDFSQENDSSASKLFEYSEEEPTEDFISDHISTSFKIISRRPKNLISRSHNIYCKYYIGNPSKCKELCNVGEIMVTLQDSLRLMETLEEILFLFEENSRTICDIIGKYVSEFSDLAKFNYFFEEYCFILRRNLKNDDFIENLDCECEFPFKSFLYIPCLNLHDAANEIERFLSDKLVKGYFFTGYINPDTKINLEINLISIFIILKYFKVLLKESH